MKTRTLFQAALLTAAAVVPAISFAQAQVDNNQAPKTRAEVRAELVQLEKAGYNPAASDDATYPADIQAAEARVHQQQAQAAAEQAPATSGYGPATSGTSQSGQ